MVIVWAQMSCNRLQCSLLILTSTRVTSVSFRPTRAPARMYSNSPRNFLGQPSFPTPSSCSSSSSGGSSRSRYVTSPMLTTACNLCFGPTFCLCGTRLGLLAVYDPVVSVQFECLFHVCPMSSECLLITLNFVSFVQLDSAWCGGLRAAVGWPYVCVGHFLWPVLCQPREESVNR